jgi:hypothetical protein
MKLTPHREWIGIVDRALVRDSLVPSDADRIGRSAVAAIASCSDRGRAMAPSAQRSPSRSTLYSADTSSRP